MPLENDDNTLYYLKKEPKKTFQTLLRNQNKLFVNAFNMIDRKAAIMIRINSTIISAIVIFFKYFVEIESGNKIAITMMATSFFSLILSINASRPDVIFALITGKKVNKKYKSLADNIYFNSRFQNTTLEEYEKAFDSLVKNQELQIGNQVRAMYLFEKKIKYSLLQIELSYIAFILGFLTVLILFISANS